MSVTAELELLAASYDDAARTLARDPAFERAAVLMRTRAMGVRDALRYIADDH